MQIFVAPKEIGYGQPAAGAMNLMFAEGGTFQEGATLAVQVNPDQAHNMVRELSAWLERQGHPLYHFPGHPNGGRAEAMKALLEEWLRTPFFETREGWEGWVAEFRPRVERLVRPEAPGGD